jgi:uncharacterized membrane protein YeaQ/YmgE (transglycosylase-associated protein family)
MSFVAWIVLGLLAGFIASQLINRRGSGTLTNIVLGIIGALVGGFLFQQFGAEGVTGLNLWSLVVATTGAAALLMVFHVLRRTSSIR